MKLLLTTLLSLFAAAKGDNDRALQFDSGEWNVAINTVAGQGFTFTTGGGAGPGPNVVIKIYNMCRKEGADRLDKGNFYPTDTVTGINADISGVLTPLAGGNAVSFLFAEGIAEDTDLYATTGDGTATVEFCAEIGLYEQATLINFAEVKLTYDVNLLTSFAALTGYTVTQADDFEDATDVDLSFDGTLEAYFCDPDTTLIMPSDGSITTQGSLISVCFRASDGQFEISDVTDFTITDSGGSGLEQLVISDGDIQSLATPFATKTCTDGGNTDTNMCVVTLLLRAVFYDFTALTLTGSGSVSLELGDAPARRRSLRLRALAGTGTEEDFMVEPQQFAVTGNSDSSATGMMSLAAIGAMAGAALAL